MRIDKNKRDAYWRAISPVNEGDSLYYHLAGADKDAREKRLDNSGLLYYFYRFVLEEKILDQIIKIQTKERANALDCGGGTGRNAITLSKHFKNVDSFDISENFIAGNKTRFADYVNIKFSVGDASLLGSLPKQYDLIFAGGWFMYLADDEIIDVLKNIKRLLPEHGILVLRDTITAQETKFASDVKIYRSEKDYEDLPQKNGYEKIAKYNGAGRNIWCSLFRRLPRWAKNNRIIFIFFKRLIRNFISIDAGLAMEQPFRRRKMANQIFYIYKKI